MLDEARLAVRRRARPAPRPAAASLQPWVIPFDYGARFQLKGEPGNVVQAVINISPDGVFVATAIGYGFEHQPVTKLPLDRENPLIVPGDVTLGELPADALVQGFRISPEVTSLIFDQQASGIADFGAVPFDLRRRLLQKAVRAPDVSFLFSVVDSSTGRELQDEPLHNLASLGISNGERPFRPLARPISFLPRSTVRLNVEERSEGTEGTLFIVLYGYRAITGTHCPEPIVRALERTEVPVAQRPPVPSDRIIPFDYAAILRLQGKPDNVVEAEVPINAEGGFVATSVGYGLEPVDDRVPLRWDRVTAGPLVSALAALPTLAFSAWSATSTINLADIPLRAFPPEVLCDGIRIRPNYVRLAFRPLSAGLALNPVFPAAAVGDMFESLNRPEAVLFRYEIFDSGTGRDLQNLPLGNIAGLGIANGDRPFKRFARPMLFLPRSTIRVRVEERLGRGNLFFVFHGYKLLALPPRGLM